MRIVGLMGMRLGGLFRITSRATVPITTVKFVDRTSLFVVTIDGAITNLHFSSIQRMPDG